MFLDSPDHAVAEPDGIPDTRVDEAVRSGVRVRRFRSLNRDEPAVSATDGRAESTDTSVAVVGLAEGGLATALSFLGAGCDVVGVDMSRDRIDEIASGRASLSPSADAKLREALVSPSFSLSSELRAVASAAVVVICVPAALDAHMLPDLAPLANACADVVRKARDGQLIILTAASYVGATRELLIEPLEALGFIVGDNLNVVFSPMNVDGGEGATPRLIGGATPACVARASRVLQSLDGPISGLSSVEAAEMARLFENTVRTVSQALIGELASACHELGVPSAEVIDAAVPSSALVGTDGVAAESCTGPSTDPYHLAWQMRRYRHRMPLVEAAMLTIAERPIEVAGRVQDMLAQQGVAIGSARVLIVGLGRSHFAVDPQNVATVDIIHRLLRQGVQLEIVDRWPGTLEVNESVSLPVVRLADVDVAAFDLVLVNAAFDGADVQDLAEARVVLDVSCQLAAASRRAAV